jgi:hypothetical protein
MGKAPPSGKPAGGSRRQTTRIRGLCALEQAASPRSPEHGHAARALGSGSRQGARIPATTRGGRALGPAPGRPPLAVGLARRFRGLARQGPPPARSYGRVGLRGRPRMFSLDLREKSKQASQKRLYFEENGIFILSKAVQWLKRSNLHTVRSPILPQIKKRAKLSLVWPFS